MAIDTKGLMDLVGKFSMNVGRLEFYNPAIAYFGVDISVSKGVLQIFIALPLDKSKRGFANPGERRYDHENNYVFTLSSEECYAIIRRWDALLAGTYVKPNAKEDDKYKNVFELIHKQRKMFIGPTTEMTTQKPTLRIGIYDPERSGSANYLLRTANGELEIFKNFVENGYKMLPFMSSFSNGLLKSLKSTLYTMGTNGTNGNGNTSAPASPQESSSGEWDFGGDQDTVAPVDNTPEPESGPASETTSPDNFDPFGEFDSPKPQETPGVNPAPGGGNVIDVHADDWEF